MTIVSTRLDENTLRLVNDYRMATGRTKSGAIKALIEIGLRSVEEEKGRGGRHDGAAIEVIRRATLHSLAAHLVSMDLLVEDEAHRKEVQQQIKAIYNNMLRRYQGAEGTA